MRSWKNLSSLFLALFLSAVFVQADPIQDSINATLNPAGGQFWSATDLGWNYTPSFSYNLSGIMTKFGGGCLGPCPSSVTVVLESSPGGSVIASATFTPVIGVLSGAGVFSGATFAAPVSLVAGTSYFVGFENVANLAVNVTSDAGAVSLGTIYADSGGAIFNQTFTATPFPQPILEFSGTPAVPEPSSFLLLGTGLIGGIGAMRPRFPK